MIDPTPRRRLPHLQRETNRHGKTAWYVRLGKGKRMRIRGDYGSPEFEAAYRDALAGRSAGAPARGPTEGSFSWALALYRRSQDWAALSIASRRQRENIFAKIDAPHGTSKLTAWRRRDIVAGRDKRADRPAAARRFVEAQRGFFEWCVEAGLIRTDPTAGVSVAKPKTDGFAVWTEADVSAFRGRWPLGSRERVAFELIYATGLCAGATPCALGAGA